MRRGPEDEALWRKQGRIHYLLPICSLQPTWGPHNVLKPLYELYYFDNY